MVKIAIFTEGQSELIFVRELLLQTFDASQLSFDCYRLQAGREHSVGYKYSSTDPLIYFLILNVQSDEGVLSTIKERETRLWSKGYHRIIGLRDLYSREYHQLAGAAVEETMIQQFKDSFQNTVNSMNKPSDIAFHFAIMELEAWYLSMYNLFLKIHKSLSLQHIEDKLDICLRTIDPQKAFYRPSQTLSKILELAGIDYDKSQDVSEMICRKMNKTDFSNAIENGRCEAFRKFYREIESHNRALS